MRIIAIAIALLAGISGASAQRAGIAYWNVDRLYDTIPSPFYNDGDFTPRGRYGWTSERYRRKVARVAGVMDSMAMPVTVLYGVENESVARDIAAACKSDYSYIHRTINSLNGLDFALFYFGDALIPDRVTLDRRSMCVHCRMAGRKTVLLMCRDAVDAARTAAEIRREERDAVLIVMGRQEPSRMVREGLTDAFAAEERAGRGHTVRGGVWVFDERICTDTLLTVKAGVYARRRMFGRDVSAGPEPAVAARGYVGGTSRHLPLFVTVEWPAHEPAAAAADENR